jgi:hypothetical protein
METKTTKFKEWDYWYDVQCKVKRRGVKTAMKEYKKNKTGNVRINVTLRRVRSNVVV